MNYSSLEYIIGNFYGTAPYKQISYLSKFLDDNYHRTMESIVMDKHYPRTYPSFNPESNYPHERYAEYTHFTPSMFLKPARPEAKMVRNDGEIKKIAEETFVLMMNKKLPDNISINILSLGGFKKAHSQFGRWSNGILGFSLNGIQKQVFVREGRLDAVTLVLGHEIGHVMTNTLSNWHDEEAKAFAFSIEWARTIKKHNIANLALSIKEQFEPARNNLHDVAYSFVNLMIQRGISPMDLHDNLARKYTSLLNAYF